MWEGRQVEEGQRWQSDLNTVCTCTSGEVTCQADIKGKKKKKKKILGLPLVLFFYFFFSLTSTNDYCNKGNTQENLPVNLAKI